MRNAVWQSANCWNYSLHGKTFFRVVGFYDSIKTWWNRIGREKLEISSSFKVLLFTKSCKVFLDFACKCRCWVSISPILYRFSNLFFCFSYGVFVVKNYKTSAFFVRLNLFSALCKSSLRDVLCSKVELLLILKFMFLEIKLLIFCRNNYAFSIWISFSKLSSQISVALTIA